MIRATVVSVLVLSACGRTPLPWGDELKSPDAPANKHAEALIGSWRFDSLTAAICNDWRRTWTFAADGTFGAVRETDRRKDTDGCEKHRTSAEGSWSVTGRRAILTLPSERHELSFAAFAQSPRLKLSDRTIGSPGQVLSAYAFELRPDGSWLGHRSVEREGVRTTTTTTVRIVPRLTAENDTRPCIFELRVVAERVGAQADEAFTVPCTRLADAASGWRAAGRLDRSYERFTVVQEAGVFTRHPKPLADAIYEATVLALASHGGQADVAVPLEQSEESMGWYRRAPSN